MLAVDNPGQVRRGRAAVQAGAGDLGEKALGPEHPHVATNLMNYAALLRKTGRSAEASKMEARAKAIRAKHAEQNPAN